MRTLRYKITGFILIASLLFGCNDKFLDTKPVATTDETTLFSTMEGADMAVTACYSNFSTEKLWDLSILMAMGSIATDEADAGGAGKSDVPEYQAMDELTYQSTTPHVFDWTYGYLFRTINYCNVALENLPTIPASAKGYDPKVVTERMGEAYFLRAFNYFVLTEMYGGVPLVDHTLSPSDYYQPRADISAIYSLIKSDLNKAVKDLPVKWGAMDVGRASKGAAEALMAKVYLFESSYAKYYPNDPDNRFVGLSQHWDSVIYWADKVINSGVYKLVGIDGKRYPSWRDTTNGVGGYTWLFQAGANNSQEAVFSIQSRHDGLGWFYSRGTSLIQWCAPRQLIVNGSASDYGWGWLCPSDQLVASFAMETGNPNDDPRYKATVMEDTDSVLYSKDDVWVKPSFTAIKAASGVHRAQRKYECSPEEFWNNPNSWKEGPTNVKIIRYADVIMWESEAYLELGDNVNALKYINMVRKRAEMSGNTGYPKPLTSITHQDIEYERMREFGCEGLRYYDVIRWNLGTKYLSTTLADGTKVTFEPGKEFFPLPSDQVQLSKGKLQQYPGSGY